MRAIGSRQRINHRPGGGTARGFTSPYTGGPAHATSQIRPRPGQLARRCPACRIPDGQHRDHLRGRDRLQEKRAADLKRRIARFEVRSPRTYERGNGHSWIADQARVMLHRGDGDGGISAAEKRLAAHQREVDAEMPGSCSSATPGPARRPRRRSPAPQSRPARAQAVPVRRRADLLRPGPSPGPTARAVSLSGPCRRSRTSCPTRWPDDRPPTCGPAWRCHRAPTRSTCRASPSARLPARKPPTPRPWPAGT